LLIGYVGQGIAPCSTIFSLLRAFMISLVKKIGRYEFDILSVVALVELPPNHSAANYVAYEVSLPHGVKLMLSAEEKAEFDNAINFHKQVLYVYGAAVGMGLRA
jgi:hypothetical protein